ncbi:hypothetical protein D9619_008569 [Psilocybe cf. subviscida]|uniref:Protein-S-isoprenylcysteine O-methyltransferase n=1 Tax=Psilocybe cf. subviscida TaxID=2480587 RepID=A0A8H5F116_9AGAR|nr:hypothetical protein D9619_008569 [Psilocybe cf. subviscida]
MQPSRPFDYSTSCLSPFPSPFTMSLYKIPLIIFLTRDFVSILTPPQPEPSKEETAKTITIDVRGVRQLRHAIVRNGQILLATLETLSIIFHHLQPSTQSTITRRMSVAHFADVLPQLRTTQLSLFGAVMWIAGTRLRLAAFARLGHFFRFDISIQRSHKLITTGPYAYVRHPSYTGIILTNIGWICYQLASGSWLRESGVLKSSLGKLLVSVYLGFGLLPTLFVTLGRLRKEEDMLRASFGKEWEEWARQVPYKVIPGVY